MAKNACGFQWLNNDLLFYKSISFHFFDFWETKSMASQTKKHIFLKQTFKKQKHASAGGIYGNVLEFALSDVFLRFPGLL